MLQQDGLGDCDGRDPETTVSAIICPNILNTSAVRVSRNGDGEERQVGDGASPRLGVTGRDYRCGDGS